MSIRSLAAISAAVMLALGSLAHAQPASAPMAAPAEMPAPAPAAVPAPAAAPAAPVAEAGDGKVAWYGRKFAGRKTANGERFDPDALTMAHKTLPFGTLVRVTNSKNNKSVVVRVNDRGPMTSNRVGDVSQAAARKLQMTRAGEVDAKLEVVGKGNTGGGTKMRRGQKAK